MMLENDHYQKLNLAYNPFSILTGNELLQVSYERFNLQELAKHINANNSCFVEFYGKKGHGKSTTLELLSKKYLPEAQFVPLKKKTTQFIFPTQKLLIIDSFQLLSPKNKLLLLNKQEKLIIGAHYSHRWFQFSNKAFNESINFNRLDFSLKLLEKIVSSRIKLASINPKMAVPKVKPEHLEKLLNKHHTNMRAIQFTLYNDFLTEKKIYEL